MVVFRHARARARVCVCVYVYFMAQRGGGGGTQASGQRVERDIERCKSGYALEAIVCI